MTKNSTRHNRLVDISPVPDVEGSDKICLTLKTTGYTSEERSFRSVPSIDRMAFRAFPARVTWIDNNHWNARFLSFVFYELTELVERPRVVDISIAPPNGCPHPYAFEVLDGYSERGAFGFLNDLLRYDMVGISRKPALLSGELLQMAFSRFSSSRLQSGSQACIVFPDFIDPIPGIVLTRGINGNVYDAHVNADNVLVLNHGFFWHFNGNHEVEQLISPDKITLSPYSLKRYLSVFSDGYGYPYPSMNGADAHRIHSLEAQYPLIIDNGSKIPEYMKGCPVCLVRFHNLRYDPDGELRCQSEFFPDIPVDDFLDQDLVEQPLFPCYIRNEVAGIIELKEGIDESQPLVIIRKQLDLEGLKHKIDIHNQYITASQLLPPLKHVGFLATESVKYRYIMIKLGRMAASS